MTRSHLTTNQQQKLEVYRDLLLERNARMNLTAIRDAEGVDQRLIDESLRLLPFIDEFCSAGSEAVDIGTGAGVPGLPIAIARPEIRWTLIDATAKKVGFIKEMLEELSLENVVLYHGRIETLAHEEHLRGRYHCLTARAVSSLPALMELGLPMVRIGGTLLLPKGCSIDEELDDGARAAEELGGRIVSSECLPEAGTSVETRLVIVSKERETPAEYPRRDGVPGRSPLGSDPSRNVSTR